MDPITFSNSNSQDKRLYIANSPSNSVGWCACFYVAPQASDTLTLLESWRANDKGIYLFLKDAPLNEQAFVENLEIYLKSLPWAYGHNYFFWIKDPNDIDTSSVFLELTGGSMTSRNVYNDLTISFGGYLQLAISNKCNFDISTDANYFILTQSKTNTYLTFSNASDTTHTKIVNRQFFIPMFGPSRGCIRLDLELDGANDWNAFDTGLRYFYPNGNAEQPITSLQYPILGYDYTQTIPVHASLDFADQINENAYLRTYFAFADSTQVFPTYFRSNYGLSMSMAPNALFQDNPDNFPFEEPIDNETALLVFSPRDAQKIENYYLVPSGQFFLSMDENSPTIAAMRNFLCGLSGSETISFMPQEGAFSGDILTFNDKQSAYAPAFPIPVDTSSSSQDNALLTNTYLTAWMAIIPGNNRPNISEGADAIRYISQPRGASLFYIDEITTETGTPFLDFYEPTTADLSKSTSVIYVPMGVYGSFNNKDASSLATYSDFETYILNPTRKSTIEEAVLSSQATLCSETGEGDIQAVTNQGFLVEIDSTTSCWTKLALAKNYTGSDANNSSNSLTLAFLNLSARLRSAFQTNQQFLVISLNGEDPDTNKNILGQFENTIQMEGWPFILNVPTENPYGQYNNVLIFKFCEGTLYERIQNPQLWTNSSDFNVPNGDYGLNALSSWLTDYVKDGIDQASGSSPDPDFAYFAEIVQDPAWNGVLALKTDIDLQNFPQGLQGLLAGIDQSLFNAHHFGININQIAIEGQTKLALNPQSSMFGLIYYIDPAFAEYGPSQISAYKQSLTFDDSNPYDFKTLSLKVLFENAKIKSYQSYIQLSVYEMFGSAVAEEKANNNILILSGSYQDHNGSPSYSFNGVDDELIPLENPVFNGVEVTQSSFNTLIPTDQSEENQVYCQFALWGYLNFATLEGIDLFSFGSDGTKEEATKGMGLSYSQLYINMNFNLNTPTVQFFDFDASLLSFDLATSLTRSGSIYNHFPIQFTGLAYGDSGNPPSNQGFVSVTTPDYAGSGDLTEDWYGLMFNFNMGTAGSLGSKAGFKARFIVGWTATSGTVYTGMQLPGLSTKSKLLSLQSVVKLNVSNIQLLKATEQGSTEADAYLMLFDDITIKFFNKQFPPGVSIDFYLFGDPNENSQPNSLGWYAAYNKKSS